MNSIQEIRLNIFKRDGWRCQYCGRHLSTGMAQVAHLVNASKMNIKKYGKERIHHPDNMKSACNLKCNAALSLYGKDKQIEVLMESIEEKLNE